MRIVSGYHRGLLYGLAYGLFQSLMSLFVHIGAGVDSVDLSFYRGVIGFIFYVGLAAPQTKALVRKDAWPLWLRVTAASLSILCYYWTVQRTTIGIASSMLNLAPVFVVIFSALFLGEHIGRGEMIAMGIAVASVSGLGAGIPTLVWVAGLGGCLLAAVSFTSLRVSAQKFSVGIVVWMLSIFMMASAFILKRGDIRLPTRGQLPVVLAVGLFGVVSQFCQTKTYVFLPAPIASSLGLSSVLWASGYDVLLFGAHLSTLQLASYTTFIVAMGLLVYLRDRQAGKAVQS